MKKGLVILAAVAVLASACSGAVPAPAPTYTPYPTYTMAPTAIPPTVTVQPTQTLVPTPMPTQRLVPLAEARAILRENGFGYYDRYLDPDESNWVAYRYLSTGIFITLWTTDEVRLDEIQILFLFDDDAQVRLQYANRGIAALRGILSEDSLAALSSLNVTYNASPYNDLEEPISGTPYLVHIYQWDDTETCPPQYDWCYFFIWPSITFSGTATLRFYVIAVIVEPDASTGESSA